MSHSDLQLGHQETALHLTQDAYNVLVWCYKQCFLQISSGKGGSRKL